MPAAFVPDLLRPGDIAFTSLEGLSSFLQEIERDSLSADGQSAYWYFRYTLRRRLSTSGQALTDERGNPHHDIPAFLEPHKALILNTGEHVLEVFATAWSPLSGDVANKWFCNCIVPEMIISFCPAGIDIPWDSGCFAPQASQVGLADIEHACGMPLLHLT